MPNQPSVAVITATIGRDELIKAIQSVQAQTYPCTHYVFVDGKDYHKKVKNLLKDDYPDVIVTYLPMNTGANQMYNSYINAIAPFLVKEDIICYLDDDNWYDADHVKHLAENINKYQADYGYSLRYYANETKAHGMMIHEDNISALGFWKIPSPAHLPSFITIRGKRYNFVYTYTHNPQLYEYLIDVNCYAIRRNVAMSLATVWASVGYGNDRHITKTLFENGNRGICVGKYTVYYRTSPQTMQTDIETFVNVIGQELFDSLTPEELEIIPIQTQANSSSAYRELEKDEHGYLPWNHLTLLEKNKHIRLD